MTAYSRGDVVLVGFVFAEESGKKFPFAVEGMPSPVTWSPRISPGFCGGGHAGGRKG
ncbi:MAG: hypothetical protein ACREJL_06135 [Candidatus Methylomirabilales bacterium]